MAYENITSRDDIKSQLMLESAIWYQYKTQDERAIGLNSEMKNARNTSMAVIDGMLDRLSDLKVLDMVVDRGE